MSAVEKNKQQEAEQVARIAQISHNIRQAVRAALPAPPEQFFTLMIPGKVVDFGKFCQGFDNNGELMGPVLPNSVALSEAMLCDDMPALSGVQLGPTGKSVSRSYAATLSKLCPSGSTTGISDEVSSEKLSSAERRYQHAMGYLVGRDPNDPTKTRIDLYREKQKNYTDTFERKTKAFNAALQQATQDPRNTTPAHQRAAYDKWVSENYKTYNNFVQAAYMDWVTMGKKEEVEYYFSIVDNDSAMSRVEASKESMRAAVISDTDGSAEYQKVMLEPRNWAWLAKRKAASGPKGETVESLTFKIGRLKKVNLILRGITDKPETVRAPAAQADGDAPNEAAVNEFLQAQKDYRDASAAYNAAVKRDPKSKPDKADLEAKAQVLADKRTALGKHFEGLDKKNVEELTTRAQDAQGALFADSAKLITQQMEANEAQIREYEAQRNKLQQGSNTGSSGVVVGLQDEYADRAGIPRVPPPPPTDPNAINDADYWTSISLEVTSSYSHDQSETQSTSWSAGGSVSWGLWSAGASASHSDSHTNASRQMASASVKISFECMRVDISRGWLRGELFYDHDLRVAAGEQISPGPMKLVDLMDPSKQAAMDDAAKLAREREMERYDLFPMYPTSFLLAANVVLEIEGETADIQSHFSTSSTSASASVGYGCFTLSASAARSETKTDSTCETTASGCRITVKSPQIIGWISQIVPALPRLN